MDYSDISEIREIKDPDEVTYLLDDPKWVLLGVTGGVDKDGSPIFLYCLGRLADPEPLTLDNCVLG